MCAGYSACYVGTYRWNQQTRHHPHPQTSSLRPQTSIPIYLNTSGILIMVTPFVQKNVSKFLTPLTLASNLNSWLPYASFWSSLLQLSKLSILIYPFHTNYSVLFNHYMFIFFLFFFHETPIVKLFIAHFLLVFL